MTRSSLSHGRPAHHQSAILARALPAALLVALTAAACGRQDAPTAPSPPPIVEPDRSSTPLEWSTERYYLEITGGDMTGDPALPPCSPPSVPAGGKSVNSFVWFAWEGDELVGRSRAPYAATIEMRMRRTGSSALGVAIAGTVTGAVVDEYDRILGKRNSVFNAYAPLAMEGTVPPRAVSDPRGPVLGGLLRGQSAFNDDQGRSSFCTNVRYYLEPAPPGGVHDDPSVPPWVPGLRAPGGSAGARGRFETGDLPPGSGARARTDGGEAPARRDHRAAPAANRPISLRFLPRRGLAPRLL
jgi:hypothetical protein